MSRPERPSTRRRTAVLALGLLLALGPVLAGVPGVHTGATGTAGTSTPAVVGVYPDPIHDDDAGEFVVLDLPAGPGNETAPLTLTDGETSVTLPNVTGRVAVTAHPARVRSLVDEQVVGLDGVPPLANDGERLTLRRGATVVTTVDYGEATEGELYRRTATGWEWHPLGATAIDRHTDGPAAVTAFTLPDGESVPLDTLAGADSRIFLAGYTFTSERVADALVRARRRGVTVRVLLEGAPVGGLPARTRPVLDRLVAAGVEVRVLAGPRRRYRYHHAKYAVVDDRALVTTENWKPAGVGGRSSRGWGVVVHDGGSADHLTRVFTADAGWRDSVPWRRFRRNASFSDTLEATGSFERRHPAERLTAERVELLVTPDNGEPRLRELVREADSSLRVVQVSVGEGAFRRMLIRAARRGIEVRLLLSSAWYVEAENRALAERLNERAGREGIPLTVRLADPTNYEKVHAKGVVIDDDIAVVGSLNLNEGAARENREVLVVLHGERPAGYYARVFDADWGGTGGVPGLLLGVVGLGVLVALVVVRGLSFE